MKKLSYAEALRLAMEEEMNRDSSVFVMGEDVGVFGGCFGVTGDLVEKFGEDRVRDTPITETAIVGSAVGAAMTGSRPVAEIMFAGFLGVAMDEIFNQAAKMCYMTGGQAHVPMVLRIPDGAGIGAAAQHSERTEAWVTHVPGLKVVYPSNPADAKGLLKAAIRDEDPVMFFEHKILYNHVGDVPEEDDYIVPLGKGEIKREGSDVTIVATGIEVSHALEAAEQLAEEGIDVEVIDPRTLVPLDIDMIMKSVEKTGKLLIASEETKRGSFASEIAAEVAEEGLFYLEQPIKRVCAPDAPVPFSSVLEQAYLPNPKKIADAVREMF
ncbi:MAG: pyruvate dehydrogenase E1 component subunit beta [Halanaerobium sp. 4-GBenrich]|jgi:pyruvate dehydrogenase E1 component beta subunit|uniref:Pyruvate dehydrogenase E1 component beta subunit n=1 Tax=Halanaerobium congolense TaxID=54121 RepID=A0A1G6SV66_9FIRM|nr:alpha-ketoacid dehydrogenase subunit beta [Halanaerobium congolense]KXS49881.1 MAG: pyruvate dehydrogenase E1 component subunit beta [Halanaerobium sp. T82-1]ODS50109.1 MAG: pyruvate dehydrogenase E1 component subunit beta [Halanaerobium sp. 4-GBenrich]PTX15599.1 pyruvate dehydrogenase E1 component beta subunit [Halanaerobium congolense]PXV62406.1 pyruvate dehydrogenase E1 component beta subunit [Halanaerobium congolense]TDP16097.1 pyruvate dehydrogenase E1 component beta subunit [Halanaero